MKRVGLALSGGGFRATLYHLGVVRYLRDANILPKITHLTTVSGGSVVGAHLVLNWDRYCGSESDFEEAAGEVIRLVQMDVRNRIVRRFPFASVVNTVRRLCRLGTSRRLTRAGLLESHYERFLYGDTMLSSLPSRPRLHILATNVSEGCICSFHRGEMLMQRRTAGRRDRFDRIKVGLATVPMAVAASSAFPGFFPPLELSSWDTGADEGEFSRQAFTDGGVYDNLGLRMFRCFAQSSVRDVSALVREDFLEPDVVIAALSTAESLPEGTPLRRLHELLTSQAVDRPRPSEDPFDAIVRGLWEVIRSQKLYGDASFQSLKLADPVSQSLLNFVVESNRQLANSDHCWLNRRIVESTLQQVIGRPCMRSDAKEFDTILVSDAGGKFKVSRGGGSSGLIRTAMRSSDILMDRVWQLELETFENTPGVVFLPITNVVDRCSDPTALHPEVQRQAARIRTDLDRFSDIEVETLVQHGYCVARKMCRNHAELNVSDPPTGAPWNPMAHHRSDKAPPSKKELDHEALTVARKLRRSASRRIWSTVLSFRDWTSYVWGPLMLCLVLIVPYTIHRLKEQSRQQQLVLSAVADTSPLYSRILELLYDGPVQFVPQADFQEVDEIEMPDFSDLEIVSDSRIFDLRSPADPTQMAVPAYVYSRVKVRRKEGTVGGAQLSYQAYSSDEKLALTCRQESLNPTVSRKQEPGGGYLWQLNLDLSNVPIGGDIDVIVEGSVLSEMASLSADEGQFQFTIPAETGLAQIWVLMPEGRFYELFQLVGHPIGKPELARVVVPESMVELPVGSLATFQLINPDAEYRYRCHWRWEKEE